MQAFRNALLALVLVAAPATATPPVVLFDNAHAQTAGNADWTIKGGYSDMGDAAVLLGCTVQSQDGGRLTDARLADVDVYVTPEPNSAFNDQEKAALAKFLARGGSLYLISDHDGSDRNNDGIDSVGVLNQFSEMVGVRWENNWFNEAPNRGQTLAHPVTKGVAAVGTWGGTSMRTLDSTAKALITMSKGGAFITISQRGPGRVVCMGDSSPFDDGKGAPSDKLHDGWANPGYTHARLATNAMRWLLNREDPAEDTGHFAAFVATLNPELVGVVEKKLEFARKRHADALAKAKDRDVRATWGDDIARLNELARVLEDGGRRSMTAVNAFRLLYPGR